MQKNISSVLPAVGLFGTLMGMFSAFTGTNFNDPNMQNVMTGLMMDFGTALWTTILAVLIKILSDLWCNLSLQRRASILMTELMELKYYIFDIIEQSPAICSVVSVPTEEPTLHKPAEVPESPLQTEE
jgi:biopolymer transport protein ExbB/TolQ